jgi:hypothetical protein
MTDIIHYSEHPAYGYYGVDWKHGLPSMPGRGRIGATRGEKIYALFNMGAAEVCFIDWVSAGRYQPLKRSRSAP